MQDQSDKGDGDFIPGQIRKKDNPRNRVKFRRRQSRIKNFQSGNIPGETDMTESLTIKKPSLPAKSGYDPELLYVECSRCGSPVLWEEGRAERLLLEAGIDPLELDSSCILLTDGCPACGSSREYTVRIFRLSDNGATHITALHGHA